MKNTRYLILAFVLIFGIVLASSTVYAADITGTWQMTVETRAGSGKATFVLKQDGEVVTGTYEGSMGKQDVTGTCKENNVELNYSGSRMGATFKVTYSGTCDGDTMQGKVDLGGYGGGSFTGKLQAAK